MRGRAAFYDQPFLSYGSYWLLGKENRYMMILKIFFFKKITVFTSSRKYPKV